MQLLAGGIGNLIQQQLNGLFAQRGAGDLDGRQGGNADLRQHGVVHADDVHVLRQLIAVGLHGAHGADSDHVIVGKERGGQFPSGIQQPIHVLTGGVQTGSHGKAKLLALRQTEVMQRFPVAVPAGLKVAGADGRAEIPHLAQRPKLRHGGIGKVTVVHGHAGKGQRGMVAVQHDDRHSQDAKLLNFLTFHLRGDDQQTNTAVRCQLREALVELVAGKAAEYQRVIARAGDRVDRVDDGVDKAFVFVRQ